MDKTHLEAYGALAQALAMRTFAAAEKDDAELRGTNELLRKAPYPIYYHEHMSTFEKTATALEKLGIVKSFLSQAHPYYVFDCEVAEAHARVMQNWKNGPTFEELLELFVESFASFGPNYWGFSVESDKPFGQNGRIAAALDALVPLGYLSKSNRSFAWTKAADPILKRFRCLVAK